MDFLRDVTNKLPYVLEAELAVWAGSDALFATAELILACFRNNESNIDIRKERRFKLCRSEWKIAVSPSQIHW